MSTRRQGIFKDLILWYSVSLFTCKTTEKQSKSTEVQEHKN